MSLLRDPPTVLGNPLFIWVQVLHHLLCLMIPVSGFWICSVEQCHQPSLLFLKPQLLPLKLRLFHPDLWFCSACVRLVSLMFCTLFHDAVVSRIYNCLIPMFVHRQLFDTVVSVSVVSDIITKIS